jgi:hypothetical protein
MITIANLKSLAAKRIIDSRVLLNNRRYFASIYLAGYALELALKYRISKIMQFDNGFPENKAEFDAYYSDTRKTFLRSTIKQLRQIRHHDLTTLLFYSGEKVNIERLFFTEWNFVKTWNPEIRYKNPIIRKHRAADFLRHVQSILHEII